MEIIISTTPTLEGYQVKKYIGPIVVPVIGAGNMFKDWKAGFTDTFGGKSSGYQKVFAQFINDGVKEMISQVETHNANAILNLRIETTNLSTGKSIISLIVYGTAVFVEKL